MNDNDRTNDADAAGDRPESEHPEASTTSLTLEMQTIANVVQSVLGAPSGTRVEFHNRRHENGATLFDRAVVVWDADAARAFDNAAPLVRHVLAEHGLRSEASETPNITTDGRFQTSRTRLAGVPKGIFPLPDDDPAALLPLIHHAFITAARDVHDAKGARDLVAVLKRRHGDDAVTDAAAALFPVISRLPDPDEHARFLGLEPGKIRRRAEDPADARILEISGDGDVGGLPASGLH